MRWELALAQHPMYLLIREDTTCAERTPPWGAPTIEAYIQRIRENLAALERYSRLKLGYEWSAVELELLAQDAPEVLQDMRSYANKGRVCFYNGTYAQPHLQILSSESNLRQFQFGQRTYQELGLKPVRVYAHQEASVHDQVPQLLAAFGITYAAVPGFLTNLVWLEKGEMLLHAVRGPRFLNDRQFASWTGLDGSVVPLYLHQPIPREMTLKEMLAREYVLGRLGCPTLFIDLPDMIGIDDSWMEERSPVDFVTLDSALAARLKEDSEHSPVRLFTNWSYLEGIRAEELSRCNWHAEHQALKLEAFNSLAGALLGCSPIPTDEFWKTILKYQHHDVYCFSAPELRDKAIISLKESSATAARLAAGVAADIASNIQTDQVPGQPVVLFNTLPHAQAGLVETDTTIPDPQVINGQGELIPSESFLGNDGKTRLRFIASVDGFGYATHWIAAGGKQKTSQPPSNKPLAFENSFYRAVVREDGSFASLVVKPSGVDLIDPSKGFGNVLKATGSSAISFEHESPDQRVEHYLSDPLLRGPALDWTPLKDSWIQDTPLGRTLSISGKLGDQVLTELTLHFYHQVRRIDLSWSFRFDRASIGTFFDDDSKLLLQWPLAIKSQLCHDIPFGVIAEKQGRPFFPTSWVDLSDGICGLAFFESGTTKHWVDADTLVELLAWGEKTDAIHNGLGRYQWLKSFDQRLDGLHVFSQAIFPHPAGWLAAAVSQAARDFGTPLSAYPAERHSGSLPASQELIRLLDPAISATSIRMEGGKILCRVYAANGENAGVNAAAQGLLLRGLQTIDGTPLDFLKPYQIGELHLEPITRDGRSHE